jgi:endonuclease G
MAPSGDEPDAGSQFESFALSNMVPQNSDDNRHLWADIETAVRELVLASGDDVYVVTGPLFGASEPASLCEQVWVPLLLFKAVYDPKAGIAGVYVARNAPGRRYWLLSLADFFDRYGISPFPGVSATIAAAAADLPRPVFDRYHHPG